MGTPWGESDHVRVIAEGITEVGTSSHGGILLSPERHDNLLARFDGFQTYAGGAWYEEDNDWSAVVIAFPEAFDAAELRDAVRMVGYSDRFRHADYWKPFRRFLADTDEGRRLTRRVAAFEYLHRDSWERGSMSSSRHGRGWDVTMTQVGTGERRQAAFADYPAQRFYTDAQLAAAAA